jgi:hypothetical protein
MMQAQQDSPWLMAEMLVLQGKVDQARFIPLPKLMLDAPPTKVGTSSPHRSLSQQRSYGYQGATPSGFDTN